MNGITDQLLITVGGNIISAAIMIAGGIFVLLQNPKRDVNRLFFFLTTSTLAFTVFFVIASLQTDYDRAYFWWSLNIVDSIITVAVVHFIFRVINLHEKWRWYIILTYATALIICVVGILEPHWFVPFVSPKLYFPYYLNAGPWYLVMLAHFFILPLVPFVNLLLVYRESGGLDRKRYEYFIIMLAIGYLVGCTDFLLVFNIPLDPIFGMFIGFYFIPVAYGIFSTNLLDIRLVIKRAFYYGLGIGAIAAFLSGVVLVNDVLVGSVPWLKFWTVPLAASIIAAIVGRMVWHQAKDTDRLKYEFITVAAHKLRTPLTRIRWIIPQLLSQTTDEQLQKGITEIDTANNRLIELTNSLLEAAHTEDTGRSYAKEPLNWKELIDGVVEHFKLHMVEKRLDVLISIADDIPKMTGDSKRLASVVEIFVENAVMYTPITGSIRIAVAKTTQGIKFSVSDTGIGVNPEDQEHIFSSFFRTDAAKTTDTEGVGLGLSVAKGIIERHGGRIGMESKGAGQGSTFWFTLPART